MREFEIYDLINKIKVMSFKRNYNDLVLLEMYPGQPLLLNLIYKNKDINQKELADITLKEPATISTMVKRMEKQGLIEKINDENDKRISKLIVTSKGKEKINKLKEIETNTINCIFKNFSEEEKENVYRLLNKIKENIMEEN